MGPPGMIVLRRNCFEGRELTALHTPESKVSVRSNCAVTDSHCYPRIVAKASSERHSARFGWSLWGLPGRPLCSAFRCARTPGPACLVASRPTRCRTHMVRQVNNVSAFLEEAAVARPTRVHEFANCQRVDKLRRRIQASNSRRCSRPRQEMAICQPAEVMSEYVVEMMTTAP